MTRKLLALIVLLTPPALAEIPLPPTPAKYVTDAAGVLDDARENALNEKLAQYERETSNQLIVYVDRRVPAGTTLEEMGAEAARKWGVGQAKTSNGAILFLFIDDRASRIVTGYGLEEKLTDAHSKRILMELRPQLRDSDYIGAVETGVDRMIATIADPNATPPVEASTVAERESQKFPWTFFLVGLFGFGGLFVFGFIKSLRAQHASATSPNRNSWLSDSSSSSSSSWSDSSSSSSSSDSSSSFSGGGGSSGGGGASDSW